MSAAPKQIGEVIAAFRQAIKGSQEAVLASQFAALEAHTSRVQQLLCDAADSLRASRRSAPQELDELRKELRVYASVLRRASRYVQAQTNAFALCAHEYSYGPGSWTASAIRARR